MVGRMIRSATQPVVVYAVAGGDGTLRPAVAVNPTATYERVHRLEGPPRFTPTYRRPHRSLGGRFDAGLLTVTGGNPVMLVQIAGEITQALLDQQSVSPLHAGSGAVSVQLVLPQQYRSTWTEHLAALDRDSRPRD